jgi:hypothetical protein
LTSFSGFAVTRILAENAERKNVSVEATINGRRALVVLERLPLRAEIVPKILTVSRFTQQWKGNVIKLLSMY